MKFHLLKFSPFAGLRTRITGTKSIRAQKQKQMTIKIIAPDRGGCDDDLRNIVLRKRGFTDPTKSKCELDERKKRKKAP